MFMEEKEFLQTIAYHKKMLGNLKRYLTIGVVVSGISIFLITGTTHKWIGYLLFIISIAWTLIVGYAIYKGNQKANKIIDEFEKEKK